MIFCIKCIWSFASNPINFNNGISCVTHRINKSVVKIWFSELSKDFCIIDPKRKILRYHQVILHCKEVCQFVLTYTLITYKACNLKDHIHYNSVVGLKVYSFRSSVLKLLSLCQIQMLPYLFAYFNIKHSCLCFLKSVHFKFFFNIISVADKLNEILKNFNRCQPHCFCSIGFYTKLKDKSFFNI